MTRFHWWRTVFWLIPTIAIYTVVLGTLSLGSSLFTQRGYFAHRCARLWSWLILATTGVRVQVRGLERLQPGTTYVFVSNHQSIYDIPVLFWSLPFQLRIIAKESLGHFPFLGWHLRRTGHMLVDRSRPDRTKIFGWASRLTSQGLSLIVFPEGTRSRSGRVGEEVLFFEPEDENCMYQRQQRKMDASAAGGGSGGKSSSRQRAR